MSEHTLGWTNFDQLELKTFHLRVHPLRSQGETQFVEPVFCNRPQFIVGLDPDMRFVREKY